MKNREEIAGFLEFLKGVPFEYSANLHVRQSCEEDVQLYNACCVLWNAISWTTRARRGLSGKSFRLCRIIGESRKEQIGCGRWQNS